MQNNWNSLARFVRLQNRCYRSSRENLTKEVHGFFGRYKFKVNFYFVFIVDYFIIATFLQRNSEVP